MCGITGFISINHNKNQLKIMTEALGNRVPDASGYFYDKYKAVGLGHRRLSIIDVSDAANQPMKSSCVRYVMVYNGEVYNFKDIAKELVNISWKICSDSQVVLEAFTKWGVEFVNKLN